ncbi:MAG: hypothetical protein NWF03_05105, partial [Candidatus Bathyarchaeota archaeon]|nr:hypothetical protein [Candidatus Bathyarchaeota archaeon]
MKKVYSLFIIVSLLVVSVVTFAIVYNSPQAKPEAKPFYVGVTYCGNSEQEAMLLVDKVKNYTNLFVLQSGMLQHNLTRMEQICDYAVDSGLNVIAYFGSHVSQVDAAASFSTTAQERWGDKFLGVYYGDESGGKA